MNGRIRYSLACKAHRAGAWSAALPAASQIPEALGAARVPSREPTGRSAAHKLAEKPRDACEPGAPLRERGHDPTAIIMPVIGESLLSFRTHDHVLPFSANWHESYASARVVYG